MTGRGPVAVARTNPRFSASGRYSTSLVTDDRGRFALQGWVLTPSGPRRRFVRPVTDPTRIVGLPAEDGRTVLVDHSAGVLAVLDGEGRCDRAPIPVEGCRFLPAPAGVALAVGIRSARSGSRILLVRDDGVTELADVEAPLGHGWPFGDGRMLLVAAAGSATAYLLDLRDGRAERVPEESIPAGTVPIGVGATTVGAGGQRFALVEPSSGRLLLGSLTEPPRALPLPAEAGRATPVALDPAGSRLAVVVEHGATSRLMLLDDAGGHRIEQPPASLLPAAGWTADGLWGIGSAPDRPPGYYWIAPHDGPLRWSVSAEPGPAARLESFTGADGGQLEAVVYGPDWRAAERVVLALHGGPRDSWRMSFDPALRLLAEHGTLTCTYSCMATSPIMPCDVTGFIR